MKKIFLAAFLCCSGSLWAQSADSLLLNRVFREIMLHSNCYDNLSVLTKTIGHRLSGSPQADQAVEWAREAMLQAGADSVWLQPVDVPYWTRGEEWFSIQNSKGGYDPVPVLSLGNTEGTGGAVLNAEICAVADLAAFEKLDPSQVKGKIVFFNYHFRQDWVNTFEGYGDAVKYRWVAVNKASEKSAAAVIIRSIATGLDDVAHTGASRYTEGLNHIPAMAIGNRSADALWKACNDGKVQARLMSNCGMQGAKRSYNVIGQISGSTKASEIIVAGAHLDSWDVGEGAHDDGAGCVQVIEMLRTLKSLGIKPSRTFRAVLYMNEENGVKGGIAYADSAREAKEQHIFAMESDAGGFVPRGIGLDMPPDAKRKVQSWAPLFAPYNVNDFSQEEGGVDIGPLKKLGVPLAGLLPDPQRYFDLHHSENDVLEAVNHRELKLGAWTMTALMLLVDKYF